MQKTQHTAAPGAGAMQEMSILPKKAPDTAATATPNLYADQTSVSTHGFRVP